MGGKLLDAQRGNQPIWTLAFCPQKFESNDNVLAIGSWDEKLTLNTVVQGKELNMIG